MSTERSSSRKNSRRESRRRHVSVLLAALGFSTAAVVLWGAAVLAGPGDIQPTKIRTTPESRCTSIAQAHPEVQHLLSLGFTRTAYEPWAKNDGVSALGGIVTYSLPDSSPGVSIIGRVWPTVIYDDTEATDPPYTISDVTQDLTGVTTVEVWVDLNLGIVAGMTDVPGFSIDEMGPDEPSDEPTCPPFS